MPFYRCYRAYVRGKVLSFRLKEKEFSPEERRVAAEWARALLRDVGGVILDASFRSAAERVAACRMSEEAGAEWRLIECRLAPEQVRARLVKRAARQEGFSDATWEIYLRQQTEYEPLCAETDNDCLVLETSGSLLATARTATDWLRRREASPTHEAERAI